MSKRYYQTVKRISRPPGTSEDAWDLFCAAAEGHLPTIRDCIEKDRGADVNSRVVSNNERNGMTPLIYCAWWCGDDEECIKIAEFLIESGADLSAKDAEGKSAVERALQQGHTNLAAALKARGCS